MISLEPPPASTARWRPPDLRRSPCARAVARAFTPPPPNPIWDWADANVRLVNEDAAEPGAYRSAKTPWTRRIQDLFRYPEMWVWNSTASRYERVPVREINVQKSSQSGYSEACLNGIRWHATYRPRNVIYAIDSADEARKIADRLLRSLELLDRTIFTGEPDDIKSLWFKLRGMSVLFYGSFSPGKFANKQAPILITDELEEHARTKGDTTTDRNVKSRKKTSKLGIQVNLSKPKLKGGPINKAFERGNQEHKYVPCPHCGHLQPLTFFPEEWESPFTGNLIDPENPKTPPQQHQELQPSEKIPLPTTPQELHRRLLPEPLPAGQTRKLTTGRIVFEHCKDILGRWDKLRILHETYYECAACKTPIREHEHKRWMLDRLQWLPTVLTGTPGIVSQQCNDLYSEDELSAWGEIVLEYLDAKQEGYTELQGFYNHRLGKPWNESANTTSEKDILDNIAGRTLYLVDAPDSHGHPRRHIFHDLPSAERLVTVASITGPAPAIIHSTCPPYKRGTLPFVPYGGDREGKGGALILGADVHGNYSKWAIGAIAPNARDVAIIDWGEDLGPDEILALCLTRLFADPAGKKHRVSQGFIDSHWRPVDVYATCIASRGLLIPTVGIGGASASDNRLFSYQQIPTYEKARLKKLTFNKQRAHDLFYRDAIKLRRSRVWYPIDVADDPEFIDEHLHEFQEEKKGRLVWSDEPDGPNHYGDCVEEIVIGKEFLTPKK